jgi:hypothetical protein
MEKAVGVIDSGCLLSKDCSLLHSFQKALRTPLIRHLPVGFDPQSSNLQVLLLEPIE